MLKLKHYGRGNEEVIILLHGGEISSWMWEESAELLGENFHCIALDLPGHGENFNMNFSINGAVRLLLKVLRAAVPEKKVHLAGVGLGGQIALKMAYEHPDLVKSVILSGVVLNSKNYGAISKLKDNYGKKVSSNVSSVKRRMKRLGIPIVNINKFTKDLHFIKPETYIDIRRESVEFSMPEYAPSLRIPALIVVGEKEDNLVKSSVPKIAEYFHLTQKLEVAKGEHFWMLEKPKTFSRLVTRFIDNFST